MFKQKSLACLWSIADSLDVFDLFEIHDMLTFTKTSNAKILVNT